MVAKRFPPTVEYFNCNLKPQQPKTSIKPQANALRGAWILPLRAVVFNLAVSSSKCNKVKFISPVSLEVKSVFRKEQFSRAFPR